MSAFNLFAPSPQNDCLVEFKAGKCTLEGKMVRPDKRKGLVQVKQSDDGLIHFVWKERVSGQVENDLIIFPDDAVFRKVKESNGRVYLLEFKNSSKKLFFWMQEFSDEKDEQWCTDINKHFTEPPTPGGEENSQIEQILQLASQQTGVPVDVLRSNLGERGVLPPRAGAGRPGGAARPNPTAASRPAPSGSGGSGGADIRGILAGLGRGASTPAPAPATADLRSMLGRLGGAQQPQQPKGPQLNDVINVDEIVASGLLEHEDVLQKLAEFLPPGPVTAQNLKDNLRSPQFQQAVTLFNQALRGGEMATIMASFGLDVAGLGPNPTIEDFLQAIQKQVKKEADLKKQ